MSHDAIVAAARAWIGTPYHHQASLMGIGCDCLGLLRGVWREVIGPEPAPIPAYRPDWAESLGGEPMLLAAQAHLVALPCEAAGAGDVLLFRWRERLPAKHCAILSGAGTMIHAHDGASVAEVALAPFWARRVAAAFRFPERHLSRPALGRREGEVESAKPTG